jgi:hypothetical protein
VTRLRAESRVRSDSFLERVPAEYTLPLRFAASRLKWALLLALSTMFVVAGVWIVPQSAFTGYGSIVFFGLGTVVAGINLLPNASFLLVDVSGFTFAGLFRRHFVSWSDVEKFVPAQVHMKRMVGWNFTAEYRKAKHLRIVNTVLAGAEAALPDTYGKSAAELIELLENCRVQYGRRPESL